MTAKMSGEAQGEAKSPQESAQHLPMPEITRGIVDTLCTALSDTPELFLTELIANSIAALDRAGFDDKNPAFEFGIQLHANHTRRTLTVVDSGVGISREESIHQLPRVPHADIVAKALAARGPGQFDVRGWQLGFYTMLVVADRVQVYSVREGEPQHLWEYAGGDSFTVSNASLPGHNRGTAIVLHLKSEHTRFLDPKLLRELLLAESHTVYYKYILKYPVSMWLEPVTPESELQLCWREMRSPPLWLRDPTDVAPEEYTAFYQHQFDSPHHELWSPQSHVSTYHLSAIYISDSANGVI